MTNLPEPDLPDFDEVMHSLNEMKTILEELLQQNPYHAELEAYIQDAQSLINYLGNEDDDAFEDVD